MQNQLNRIESILKNRSLSRWYRAQTLLCSEKTSNQALWLIQNQQRTRSIFFQTIKHFRNILLSTAVSPVPLISPSICQTKKNIVWTKKLHFLWFRLRFCTQPLLTHQFLFSLHPRCLFPIYNSRQVFQKFFNHIIDPHFKDPFHGKFLNELYSTRRRIFGDQRFIAQEWPLFSTNFRIDKVYSDQLFCTKKVFTFWNQQITFLPQLSSKPSLHDQVFQHFEKSNQNTYFFQRPLCHQFRWIQNGDLFGDCSASDQGELALGKNMFVAYLPWEGFNFEDALFINEKVLSKYTSLHIEKYETEFIETTHGLEKMIREIPGLDPKDFQKLDKNGIVQIGTWVEEGDILVGKITPTAPKTVLTHEKLLYDIVGQKISEIQEKSLRVPQGVSGRIIKIAFTKVLSQQEPVDLQNSQLSLKNQTFSKDSISKELKNLKIDLLHDRTTLKLFQQGMRSELNYLKKERIFKKWEIKLKAESFLMTKNRKILDSRALRVHQTKDQFPFSDLRRISIYIAEKRTFKVGDKISGRHGNKGILSKICPDYDMPYLPNGQSLDIVLNPLGVPSRMNVGQIFECLLGLTGQILNTKFRILCFDEMQGYEASRSWVYSKLFESCDQTKQKWLFSKKTPGKFHLFDGRNGQLFHQSILIGCTYLMKLIHIVDEKIHARSTGPYSMITQQPLRGRSKKGGQRVGEMEVWALQGYGSAYTLQELLTVKSDDLQGRQQILQTLLKNTPLRFGTPESLRVVLRELQCLCLDLHLCSE